jgi:glycosyltransferase involved in cell wall biosynthesis
VAAAWASDAGGLGRLARKREVALVHTNTSVTLGGAAAARVAGLPHVWHVREIYAGFDRWFPAYRRLLLTATSLPCVSRATCEQFDGAPQAFVLHDGLAYDPERIDRAAARAELGLPAEGFVVAVLGRISGWKGQDVLVRALAQLPDDAHGLVAGDAWRGEERHVRELHELATSLGVGDRTHLVGHIDRPSVVFGAADVVVVPSKQPDPLPNAALEAAACGCCVVAANHGGIPEIIRHEETGVLVPPNDVHALATTLAGLQRDPERRARLAGAAVQRIPKIFSREKLLDEIHGLYDRLIAA